MHQEKAGKRGTISVQMTADELLSIAVNIANGWSLEDLGFDQTTHPVGMKKMLGEVWELLLDAHRRAVESR